MKKRLACIFFIIFFLFIENIYADEYYVNDIENKFIGIYLPINYLNSLNITLNHYISLRLNRNRNYHDILIVKKNIIYSNVAFHDGYAIRSNEVVNYSFIDNENIKIIDNNKYEYIKISDETNNYGLLFSNYIGKIIFSNAISDKKIQCKDDKFIVNNTNIEFAINLYSFMTSNPNLVLVSNNELLFMELINGNYIIYRTKRVDVMERERTDEIFFEF